MDTLDFFMPFLLGRCCDEHLMMCEHPFCIVEYLVRETCPQVGFVG